MIPTGYSFNLDGTSIYLTMAAVFIAQATNTPMTLTQQLTLLAVLLLTSKGAAGVTGSGFIVLAATLSAVGNVPVAGLALILGIDRFMSEARALTNLIGNGVATVVVGKWMRRARRRSACAGMLDNENRMRKAGGARGRARRRTASMAHARDSARSTALRARSPGDSDRGHESDTPRHARLHRIVIVGGGAGGLELATRLGDKLGKRGTARRHADRRERAPTSGSPSCTRSPPAAWTSSAHEVDYLAQAHWHRFRYRIGEMIGLDRERREVHVAPYPRRGRPQVTPRRVVRLRHAGHRGRQPEQRLRHAGRARARDEAGDAGAMPSASTAAWSTPASARMRRRRRCVRSS